MQAGGLRDEGLADPGLADQEDGSGIVQPLQAVEFLDLRFTDRATGGEVDVLECRAQRELGGFDAIAGFSLLAIIGFGLQQCIKQLAVAGFVASGLVQDFVEGLEHAEQFYLGHQVFGNGSAHRSKVSWLGVEGTGTAWLPPVLPAPA